MHGFSQVKVELYRFYDKKVVVCHPLCHDLEMWKLLVILVVIKLYAQIDIFKLLLYVNFIVKDFGARKLAGIHFDS